MSTRPDRFALIAILVLAAALRFAWIETVPLGLSPDEAVNGYDAYSIARTGRDHHGNALPLTMQAFNDYRMPAFVYSLVPFVAFFGLEPAVVRGVAAVWGLLNIVLIYGLTRDLIDRRTALLAAFLLSISIWHLPLSRYGHEGVVASCAMTLMVYVFFKWQETLELKWLFGLAVASGLAFYSYGVMVIIVPGMLIALGLIFFQRKRSYWLGMLSIVLLLMLEMAPYWYLYFRFPQLYQARFADISVLRQAGSWLSALPTVVANFFVHLSPDFLLVSGDHDLLYHPPGFGQLYWIQAPFLLLAFGTWRTHRRALALLAVWIVLAILPAALTIEGLPHSMRTVVAIVPFQILTALGFTTVVRWMAGLRRDLMLSRASAKNGLALSNILTSPTWLFVAVAAIVLLVQGVWFIGDYFLVYPHQAAGRFFYGAKEAIEFIEGQRAEAPTINVTDKLNQAYIYVLFYGRYDPKQFQSDTVRQTRGVFDPVTAFDKYFFGDIEQLYEQNPQGLYMATPTELGDLEPVLIVRNPDTTPAYLVFKR